MINFDDLNVMLKRLRQRKERDVRRYSFRSHRRSTVIPGARRSNKSNTNIPVI